MFIGISFIRNNSQARKNTFSVYSSHTHKTLLDKGLLLLKAYYSNLPLVENFGLISCDRTKRKVENHSLINSKSAFVRLNSLLLFFSFLICLRFLFDSSEDIESEEPLEWASTLNWWLLWKWEDIAPESILEDLDVVEPLWSSSQIIVESSMSEEESHITPQ